jgi:hypothetical protein
MYTHAHTQRAHRDKSAVDGRLAGIKQHTHACSSHGTGSCRSCMYHLYEPLTAHCMLSSRACQTNRKHFERMHFIRVNSVMEHEHDEKALRNPFMFVNQRTRLSPNETHALQWKPAPTQAACRLRRPYIYCSHNTLLLGSCTASEASLAVLTRCMTSECSTLNHECFHSLFLSAVGVDLLHRCFPYMQQCS